MQKAIIIGGGILGASTAYELAKAGKDVVIIDRADKGQATGAAAGIICPWLSQRRNKDWYQLAKGGAGYYPSLVKSLEQDGEIETGYEKVGAISIHTDNEKLAAMKKRALKRRETAPEIGEVTQLSPEETKKMFPVLSDGYGSVHVSGAARVDGRSLRDSLLRAAGKHGAEFIPGNARLTVSGQQVTGVRINEKELEADIVITTTGAWGSELFQPLGIDFSVREQRAQIVHLELPGSATENWPVVIPPGRHYLLAFPCSKIIAGTTYEDDTGMDARTTAGGMDEILQNAFGIAPELSNGTVIETRVGFRPFTPGFLPVFGKVPHYEGVLTANGLGATGLTMGPYIGSLLATIALGEKPSIDIEAYDPAHAMKKTENEEN